MKTKKKKPKKPISKTQGRWWIIRRPNGSLIPGTLYSTRKGAWGIAPLVTPYKAYPIERDAIYCMKKDGYTCERVQVMSTEDNGVVIESMTFNKDGTLSGRTRSWMSTSASRLTTNPDDLVRIRVRKEREEKFAEMRRLRKERSEEK